MKGWDLKLRRPIDTPFIGKFNTMVDLSQAAPPVKMYMAEEEVRDELTEMDTDLVKDADYYKRKKQHKRRKFTKKSKLTIEDDGKLGKYEGYLVDTTLDETRKEFPTAADVNDDDGLFRYALLEVVTSSSTTGGSSTEVNVIPIHSTFLFRRPAIVGDKLLDEIDDDYDEKLRNDKLKLQRYKNIGRALEEIESRGDNAGEDDKPTVNESSSAGNEFKIPLFGSKKSKVPSNRTRSKVSSGLVDEDQERALDNECGGDYSAKFVDDEEDNIVFEQNELDKREGDFAAEKDTVDVFGELEDEDSEEDEDEEDSAPKEIEIATGPIAGIDEDELRRSTRAARESLLSHLETSQPQNQPSVSATANASATATASKKRTIEDVESSTRASPATVSKPQPKEYDMSPEGIRQYITDNGGSVSTNALKEAFKSQMKKEAKKVDDKKLIQQRFVTMLAEVADTAEKGIVKLK